MPRHPALIALEYGTYIVLVFLTAAVLAPLFRG